MFDRYPYRCRIFVANGTGYIEHPDQGRHTKDKKTRETKFKFKKCKIVIPAIPNEFIQQATFGNTLYFVQKGPQEIEPVRWNAIFQENKTPPEIDYQKLSWLAQENKYASMRWRKPSAWGALLPVLPVAIAGIVSVIMLVIFMRDFGTLVDKVTPIAQYIAVSSDRLSMSMDNLAIVIQNAFPGANISFVNANFSSVFANFTV